MVIPVPASNKRRDNRAFTLSEMAIAVAIVFVMVLVVWGVIGTSQITMNLAVRKSTQARISQQLIGDLLLNNWSSIMSYHGSEHYFDGEGIKISSSSGPSDPAAESFWAYRARIQIEREQARVPGEEESSDNADEGPPVMSRKVSIQITNGPYPDYDFTSGRRHETFSTWLSKMAKN